jgi:uncharacterized membrane protein
MKKLLIITISIMIILALCSSVMAKAVPLVLEPLREETGTGKVILNNPKGAINFVVQVNLKGARDITYNVYIRAKDESSNWVVFPGDNPGAGWYKLGELITNEVGNGSFHINLELEHSGKLNDIEVALDDYVLNYYWSEKGEIEIK